MGGSLKETSYEKRIQRLMLLGEDGDQYGLYIDISNNKYRMGSKKPGTGVLGRRDRARRWSHGVAEKADLSVHYG